MISQIFSGSWNRNLFPAIRSIFSNLTPSLEKTNRIFLLFIGGGTFYGLYQTVKAIQYKYFSSSALNLDLKIIQVFLFAHQIETFLKEGKTEQANQLYPKCTTLLNATIPSNSFVRSETPDLRDQAILKLIEAYATHDHQVAFALTQKVTCAEASLKAIESLKKTEYKFDAWRAAFQEYERYHIYSVRMLLRFAKVFHSSQNPKEIELKKWVITNAINHFKTLTKASDKADSLEAFAQYMQETKETSIILDSVDMTNVANCDKFRICLAQAKIAKEKNQIRELSKMTSECIKIIYSENNDLTQFTYVRQLIKLGIEEVKMVESTLLDQTYSLADQKIAITNFTSSQDQLNTTKILLELLDIFKSIDLGKFSEMINQVHSKIIDLSEDNDGQKEDKIQCFLRISELFQEAESKTELKSYNFQRIYEIYDFDLKQEIALLICKIYKNLNNKELSGKFFKSYINDLISIDISSIEKIDLLTKIATRSDCLFPDQQTYVVDIITGRLEYYSREFADHHTIKALITAMAMAVTWIFPSSLIPVTLSAGAAHVYYGKPPR